MVRILTESEVESLLDMRAAVDVVEQALLDQACGKSTNRSRYRIALPRTMLNVMAAGVSTFHALGVKCYVVGQTGPGGAHIYVLLFDSEIGKLLAIMQADKLGQMRTGAASGVATKYLAPEGAKTLGVYGTGWQAESQVEGVAAVRQLARVVVYSRSKRRREDFATR